MAGTITAAHPNPIRHPSPSHLVERPHAALRCGAIRLLQICLLSAVCLVGLYLGLLVIDFHFKVYLNFR